MSWNFVSFYRESGTSGERVGIPLQVIRSRILMLLIRTKRTHIARRPMHKTVADHFIFPFETSATHTVDTPFDRTIVWSIR